MRELYVAYSAGLNYFVAKHPGVQPRLLRRFEPWLPLALLRFKYHQNEFVGYAGLDLRTLRIPAPEPTVERPQGSNTWAVGPSKSTTGRPLLLINPHVPFFGLAQYCEGHLHSEEGWNFSGVSRYGFPFPYMGHNEVLGWSHTDNRPDHGDLFAETFDDPSRPLSYRYGDGRRLAVQWTEEISVKTAKGFERRQFTFRKTHHGPVLAEHLGKPVALKLAKYEEGGWFDQWYEMSKARSLTEFKAALRRVAIPYMNIMYADRDGNIFYLYNGVVPRRSPQFDWTRPVDGSNPETEWRGFHSLEELPQITNPPSGYLQNCNSTPTATTASGNPERSDYPAYMIGPERDNARAQISRRILSGRDTFTFDQWAHAATDTQVWEAEQRLPELFAEWERLRSADAARAEALAPLVDELRRWDRVSRIESVAMTLFAEWVARRPNQAAGARGSAEPWDQIRKLEDVRLGLERAWGTWRAPWGEINRLQLHALERLGAVLRCTPEPTGPRGARKSGDRIQLHHRAERRLAGTQRHGQRAPLWRAGQLLRQRRRVRDRGPCTLGGLLRAERRSRLAALFRSGAALREWRVQTRLVYLARNPNTPRARLSSGGRSGEILNTQNERREPRRTRNPRRNEEDSRPGDPLRFQNGSTTMERSVPCLRGSSSPSWLILLHSE